MRSWFQIHLSTAIVLMAVVGVLGYLNSLTKPWVEGPSLYGICRGWPFPSFLYPLDKNPESEWHIAASFLGANILIALAILTAVAVGCEWWMRRREPK